MPEQNRLGKTSWLVLAVDEAGRIDNGTANFLQNLKASGIKSFPSSLFFKWNQTSSFNRFNPNSFPLYSAWSSDKTK
jgi:hypothetical protein